MDLAAKVRAFVEIEASIVAMAQLRNQFMDEVLALLPEGDCHLAVSDSHCHYFIESDDFAFNPALDILDGGLLVRVAPRTQEHSEWREYRDRE
ncbi:MAG: hypothetical protein O2890_12265 [Cyanobacteria bacterium]|nr:hypothetical protein [Cyanobacteriota bacterium]